MSRRIIMVTGGQRSGKSEFAEKTARDLSDNPVYLATSQILDDEMRHRVEIHRSRRGDEWTTVEEPLHLGSIDMTNRVVLVDCVTMWVSNMLHICEGDGQEALKRMKEEFDRFTAHDATYLIVTNEIGLGGTSANKLQRTFTDLQGSINRHIASSADDAYMLISGISMKIK